MRLRNLTFDTWLRSHGYKRPEERWLRELYPWPVLAQIDCDQKKVGETQHILYDGVEYDVTLTSAQRQARGTVRYLLRVETEGLGWHSRSFSDEFDLCGTPDGEFVTLFHRKDEEPIEKIAKAFFSRRWDSLRKQPFQSLAVSRFLAASVVSQVVQDAFQGIALSHYPGVRLVGSTGPMFASNSKLWIGYRFFSEDAFSWARRNAGCAMQVTALYFADTKYQFRTDLPAGVAVQSITQFDATNLNGRYEDLIRLLLRKLELPTRLDTTELESVVLGRTKISPVTITEANVHEALAVLKRPCTSIADLRYHLAAAVVLNAWIEDERRLGFAHRKKFYAFKQRVGEVVKWAADAGLSGVKIWAEASPPKGIILYVRIDDVDFSFHAIPYAAAYLSPANRELTWSGVRLKPIAPIVLAWARGLVSAQNPAKTVSRQ